MRPAMVPAPVVLTGQHVRLEPLTLAHHTELCDVGLEPDLWRWTVACPTSPAELREYLEEAIVQQESGSAVPFLIRHIASGQAIGSTRFANIDVANRRLEIGWTWLGAAWQRSPVNTEAKYLLLGHAFDVLGYQRVEFKTDALNEKSRNALQRIGAVQEGIFRKHMVTSTGRVRDTVYFSIIDDDWPAVRTRLEERLGRP